MLTDAEFTRHFNDLRSIWQGRVLAEAKGRMMLVVCSMLEHRDGFEALGILLQVVKPPCWDADRRSLKPPLLSSCGKVNKAGQIVAEMIVSENKLPVIKVLFDSERDFEYEVRKLADKLKFSDNERRELFAAAKRWVVCDFRLDPAMDPQDPDAKHLVH